MPAQGKVTLDAKDYEAKLESMKQKTASATSDMSRNMGNVGKGVTKAGGMLSAFGSEIGKSFGAAGQTISAFLSGPLGAATAAIGAAAALGVKIWDNLTLSAEEYAKKLERVTAEAEKHRQKVEQQAQTDQTYMDRLQELSKLESLSNAERNEAAFLIDKLTDRYGDLGISIDSVTGSLKGADEAQKKFLERMRQQKLAAVDRQMRGTDAAISGRVGSMITGSLWDQYVRSFGANVFGTMKTVGEQKQAFMNLGLDDQIKQVETLLEEANSEDDITKLQGLLDLLLKKKDLQVEQKNLKETGYTKESEAAAAKKKESAEEAKKNAEEKRAEDEAEKYRRQIDANDKALAAKKQAGLNAESDYQFNKATTDADKIANREARIRQEEALIASLQKSKEGIDVFSLSLEEAEAENHRYDMAIEEARQRIAGFNRQIQDVKDKSAAAVPENIPAAPSFSQIVKYDVVTNSLIQRGGMRGAIVDNVQNKVQKDIKDNTKKTSVTLDKINQTLGSMTT